MVDAVLCFRSAVADKICRLSEEKSALLDFTKGLTGVIMHTDWGTSCIHHAQNHRRFDRTPEPFTSDQAGWQEQGQPSMVRNDRSRNTLHLFQNIP